MSKGFPFSSVGTPTEFIELLKKESENQNFDHWLDQIAEKAISGNDKAVWSFLYQAVRDADSGRLSWGFHKKFLSGIFHILARIGDSQAYRLLINYVKSLDRTIPIGALELISDLVPTFREIDINEVLSIAANPDPLKSAFGVLALSQLVLENRLPEEKTEETKLFLQSYTNDRYFLDDTVERTLELLESPDSNLLSFVEGIALS
ncbi:hypothetical protein EHO60_07225 [Leptospira fletcheri]|uniref:HEAT repeat domain-containing protein n=1 Tax=Leptospira fletcheri TaxID=2484981 RepID=A0A4V3JDU6_9LEPT|nr:hypothetical protein [Leptospira fletcheri]TGK12055.1 hypothetical protein EHO60_07225 [Leptospira fletcheri]